MKPESSLLAESDSSSSGSSGLTSREFLEDLRVLSLVSKPEVSHLSPSSSLSTIWLRSQHLSHRTKEMYIFASMSCDNVTGRHLSLIYLNDCFSWTPIPGKVWGGKEPTHDINICICDVMWCDVTSSWSVRTVWLAYRRGQKRAVLHSGQTYRREIWEALCIFFRRKLYHPGTKMRSFSKSEFPYLSLKFPWKPLFGMILR